MAEEERKRKADAKIQAKASKKSKGLVPKEKASTLEVRQALNVERLCERCTKDRVTLSSGTRDTSRLGQCARWCYSLCLSCLDKAHPCSCTLLARAERITPRIYSDEYLREGVGLGPSCIGTASDPPPTLVVLYLGPFAISEISEEKELHWKLRLEETLQRSVKMIVGDPPFSSVEDIDAKAYWVLPHHPKPDMRRKLLRKHVLMGLVLTLSYVVQHRPQVILGVGQGGLISALMSMPLVLEVACRNRIATSDEMKKIRQTWSHVVGTISVNPMILPQKSDMSDLNTSIPELAFRQPRGVIRAVVQAGWGIPKKSFGDELAISIGTVARPEEELSLALEDFEPCLDIPVPVHIEDDASGVGICAVCGKRGVLGRCPICGMLLHMACVPPELPGREQACPRCVKSEEPALSEEERWKLGINRHRFAKNTIVSTHLGKEDEMETR